MAEPERIVEVLPDRWDRRARRMHDAGRVEEAEVYRSCATQLRSALSFDKDHEGPQDVGGNVALPADPEPEAGVDGP